MIRASSRNGDDNRSDHVVDGGRTSVRVVSSDGRNEPHGYQRDDHADGQLERQTIYGVNINAGLRSNRYSTGMNP